jgi:hypothetical protein
MGHYSCECKKPKKAKDIKMKAPGTSVSAVEADAECEGAWAAKIIEDAIERGPKPALLISKMDWFEKVIAKMDAKEVVIAKNIPAWDWFYKVAEGDNRSEDEGASLEDVSVDIFDSKVS